MLSVTTSSKYILLAVMSVFIATLFAGCEQDTPVAFPSSTEAIQFTAISTPELIASVTVLPQPTVRFAITANPEQVAHWVEYEQALARKLLSYLPPKEVLCEWEILGQDEKAVYVWAVCMGLPPPGKSEIFAPGASIPAVIHLKPNGSIQSIELPRDNYTSYVEGVQKIFPESVKEIITDRSMKIPEMMAHIRLRREKPEAPLIILWSTP